MSTVVNANGTVDIARAQAARALVDLRSKGWAVGPPTEPDAWRRAVRGAARRAGLRIRTAEALPSYSPDDLSYPWAITVEGFEAMHALMGGTTLELVGAALVRASLEGSGRPAVSPPPGSPVPS